MTHRHATARPTTSWHRPSRWTSAGTRSSSTPAILYTREYAQFCERVAGRFIHHVPQDAAGAPEHSKDPASVRNATMNAIRRVGYLVDTEFRLADAYSCGNCHEDGNCAASGKDGNENTDNRTT